MTENILNQLEELQKQSKKSLNLPIVSAIQNKAHPRTLVVQDIVANGKWVTKPIKDATSLLKPENRQSLRKIRTLAPGRDGNLTFSLNTSLLGGQNYPILNAALGTAVGLAGFGAGLLFTIGTTGLSLQQTSQRVLARSGDEIWHVEEIGKSLIGGSYKPVYVSSFFIVDPFRGQTHLGQSDSKGWLIHEERLELSLN